MTTTVLAGHELWALLEEGDRAAAAWWAAREARDGEPPTQPTLFDQPTEAPTAAEVEQLRRASRVRWRICLTWLGDGFGCDTTIAELHAEISALGEAHFPTVLSADWRPERGEEGPGDQAYRGACLVCGWVGEVHTSRRRGENTAVEDMLDHAFHDVDWRALPSVPKVPWDLGGGKKRAAWYEKHQAEAIRAGYPADWAERHGPSWTDRRHATEGRHHMGGLFGGVDLGRVA